MCYNFSYWRHDVLSYYNYSKDKLKKYKFTSVEKWKRPLCNVENIFSTQIINTELPNSDGE